jgi:ADP-heptose:LPS heptosyltransferase
LGYGDQLLGSGMARGARARGKRIAFGDGRRILWDSRSEPIFNGNPNVARPGLEADPNLEWVGFYKGHRIYNTQDTVKDRWVWNLDFHAEPGEMFFSPRERRDAERFGKGFVLIEPSVERWKKSAANKDWGQERYQQVASLLLGAGYEVAQFRHDKDPPLEGVRQLVTRDIRDALAILGHAALYIGPEGGLHHGAAAAGIPAVVLFGGFIPPSVTGYADHANLTGGAEACGSLHLCRHCQDAMRAISVDEVHAAALERL